MRLTSLLRRAALSAALAGVLAGASVAATLTDVTTLHARLANGAIETLRFDGELAPGEQRALTTANGLAAVLSRGADGLTLQLAGESFALPVAIDADGDGARAERVRVITRHDDLALDVDVLGDDEHGAAPAGGAESPRVEKRIVIRHRDEAHAGGEPGADEPDALAIDPKALLADGSGKRIVMLRTIEKRHDATAQ